MDTGIDWATPTPPKCFYNYFNCVFCFDNLCLESIPAVYVSFSDWYEVWDTLSFFYDHCLWFPRGKNWLYMISQHHPGCLVSMTCKHRGLDCVFDFCVVFTGWTRFRFGRLSKDDWGLQKFWGSRCLVWASTAGTMFRGWMWGYGSKEGRRGKKNLGPMWGKLGGRAGGSVGKSSGEQFTWEYVGSIGLRGSSDKLYVVLGGAVCNAVEFCWELVSQFSTSCKELLMLFWPYSTASCTCTWSAWVSSFRALHESFFT